MRLLYAVLVASSVISLSQQHEVVKRQSRGGRGSSSSYGGGSGGETKRVVCYYTNWSVYRPGTAKFSPQNINPYLCTHLIYAFGGLDRENGLRPYDKYQDIEQGGYAKFTGLKTYNKALKTMLAVGGWNEGSARFSPLVADDERRREFVKNVVKFLRQNHFDGLDLDWEYPAFRDGGKSRDRDNYAQLVQELREEFDRESSKTGRTRLLLTMAVPAGLEYIDKGYDIPKINRYVDFMNVLSYDYHSAFEPSVNHHSPLYSLEEEGEYNFDAQLNIDATVKHYLSKGADPDKIVLGIPTYGRSYSLFNPDSTDLGSPADGPGEQGTATREKGYLAYYEICASIKNEEWTVEQPKESAMGPYAYKGNQWVGYDDEAIIKKKAKYVMEKNLGGIMYWAIDNDDFRGSCHGKPYPLIEAGKETLLGNSGSPNKIPSSSPTRKSSSGKSTKAKSPRTTTTVAPLTISLTTPEPPTTPDPGSDFVCKDEGFFPHPRDCKKYFWCLDSGPSNLGIVAHQFTCPSGLYFNKAADSCDFSRNVLCNKKSSTTTTTTPKTSKTTVGKLASSTTTTTSTTTSTTTTEAPEEEEEEYDEEHAEEDPQAIKQLIALIKKLGGVAELEKQLEGSSGIDSTTPAISKTLYERVIAGAPRYQSKQTNGPSGPQNQGLSRGDQERKSYRRDKPQYVTIQRQRPSTTSTTEAFEDEIDSDEIEVEEKPKYVSIQRNRGSQNEGLETERQTERERPQYQSVNRFRNRNRETDSTSGPSRSTTLRYTDTNLLRSRSPTTEESTVSTSRYVTLRRQKPQVVTEEIAAAEIDSIEDDVVTEEQVETTTSTTVRPRVKTRVKVNRTAFRRPSGRGTTTSTTPVPSTTARERSTVQLLRQRLNRFRSERNSSRTLTSATTAQPKVTVVATTLRPKKYEYRRLTRPTTPLTPTTVQDSQIDASYEQSVSQGSSYGQDLVPSTEAHVTIGPSSDGVISQQYFSTEGVTTRLQQSTPAFQESSPDGQDENSGISDLANVAVAAIQSLATSPPTEPTPKFIVTTVRPSSRRPVERYTTPRGVSTTRIYSTTRALSTPRPVINRGTPRPFVKVTQVPRNLPQRDHISYDDYDEDYYAEPVDVPLAGKVRIHSDGYIECLDIGNFPHPFSCRKFISCAKMESSHLLGWEYTCPKGLSFDPIGGICNWNAGLGCKE